MFYRMIARLLMIFAPGDDENNNNNNMHNRKMTKIPITTPVPQVDFLLYDR